MTIMITPVMARRKGRTAAEHLADLRSKYPPVPKPAADIPPVTRDTVWAYVAAHQHVVHAADPANLAHLAADAAYLSPSPAAGWIRAEVTAELDQRDGGARRA